MGRFSETVVLLLIVQTSIGNPTAPPPDSQLFLGQAYFNFSAGLLDTLEKSAAGSPVPKTPVGTFAGGVDADSIFGLGNILAIANEKPWPITVPIFDSLLGSSSKSLAAAFEFVISEITQDSDVQVSNTMFAPEKLVTLTPNLSKLKVEVVNSDLQSKDAVTSINSNIAKKLITPLEDSYIPKDYTISPAAKALLVNTLQFSGNWPIAAKKLPSGSKFNGVDVEMIELTGKFQVLEFKQGVQVILPFKNEKRGLSLVLPNNEAATLISENSDEPPKLVNASTVRIQIPVFKVTLRVLENSGYSKCDFQKSDHFLQILDEVTYFSINAEKLEAISITGAQVNNVNQFKQEMGKSSGRAISSQAAANAADADPAQKGADASTAATGSSAERLIVFNKPFTWTVLDVDLGPLFAGSVSSLEFLKKTPSAAPKSNSPVFGVRDDLPYVKCL